MIENTYEVAREDKQFGDKVILSGSTHGWNNWKEFCDNLSHKYGATKKDSKTMESDKFIFHKIM
jgi:hypothetical protein